MTAAPPAAVARPRLLVAFLFYGPGLWIFFSTAIPPRLRRANALAVGATLAFTALAWAAAPAGRKGWAALVARATGHAAWGGYLAWQLRRGAR